MRLSARRTIRAPATEVFEFFADASNNPTWQSGMVSCRWVGEGPIGLGSEYEQEARFLGRPVRSRFRVVDHKPGSSITIETVESTFPIRVTRTVSPISDTTCEVTADITGDPGGVMRLVAGLTRRLAQRSVDRDYDRLVEHFEAR